MLACIQGWSLSEVPARAGPGRSQWWGSVLARVPGECAQRVVVTVAVKTL